MAIFKVKLFGWGRKDVAPSNPPESPETPPVPDQTRPGPGGRRALIVDDDPVFVKATTWKLTAAGFTVSSAAVGSEAIKAFGEAPTDVVLMDISLPPDIANGGMCSWDGFQTMSWLRNLASSKQARFIMVSSSGSEADRKRAKAMGASAYFQKPLDYTQLLAAIDTGT